MKNKIFVYGMKKLFLIGFVLILTGCSLSSKVDGKTAEEWKNEYETLLNSIEKQKTEDRDFIFKKNKECFSYKEEIEKNLPNIRYAGYEMLREIFYSPKTNSCLYVTSDDPVSVKLRKEEAVFYMLTDLFRNIDIESSLISVEQPNFSKEYREWQELIEKYKK